ncbi:MAG: MFS transporter [Pseudomonadota bacterium]
MSAQRRPPLKTNLIFSGLYGGQFALLGVQLPFFSGWLALNGFTLSEIGWLNGLALVGRLIVGPPAGLVIDRLPDRRLGLWLVAGLFFLGAAGLVVVDSRALIAAFSVLMLLAFGVLIPASDTALLTAQREEGIHYGQIRAVGSGSFVVMNILGGWLLSLAGMPILPIIMASAGAATFVFALMIPYQGAHARRSLSLKRASKLLGRMPFLLFIFAAGAIQASHATYYAFSIVHWEGQGFAYSTIGWLWATGVLAEIVLLVRARQVLLKLPATVLIAIGGIAGVVRWSIVPMGPPLPFLFLLQTLHALTFAATYLGSIAYVERRVPKQLTTTAMTILSTTGVGAASGAATVVASQLYEVSGAMAAYGLMAVLGGVGAAAALLLNRLQGPRRTVGGGQRLSTEAPPVASGGTSPETSPGASPHA